MSADAPTPLDLDALATAEAEAKHYRAQRDEWFLMESGAREAAETEVVLLRTRIRKARHQRDEARAALAVVRQPLPVKPSQEEVARAIAPESAYLTEHHPELRPSNPEVFDRARVTVKVADAGARRVLDLWPGRSEAEVAAEALRDAADEWHAEHYGTRPAAYKFLWDRADRLAAEGGADRG